MAIYIKSKREIDKIREAGKIVAKTLKLVEKAVKPGISLKELEKICADFIYSQGAYPAFLGYKGFPAAVCISLNEEVVHGIPDARILKEGDIVKIDVGVKKDGYYADGAKTFICQKTTPEIERLIRITEKALYLGIEEAYENNSLLAIGRKIQEYVEKNGFFVVKELSGHGVGLELHEDPIVPNYYVPKMNGIILKAGMILAIEPMVNFSTEKVFTKKNNWTIVTADGNYSAHFEHTVLVGKKRPEILTSDE